MLSSTYLAIDNDGGVDVGADEGAGDGVEVGLEGRGRVAHGDAVVGQLGEGLLQALDHGVQGQDLLDLDLGINRLVSESNCGLNRFMNLPPSRFC